MIKEIYVRDTQINMSCESYTVILLYYFHFYKTFYYIYTL